MKRGNLEAFRRKINEVVRKNGAHPDGGAAAIEADLELTSEDLDMRLAEELYLFEPYGVKNPVPLFYLKDAYVADESLVGGGKHTRLILKKGDVTVTAMCFRKSIGDLDIYPGDTVDALFNLDVNEFGGMRNLQMIVRDVRLAERSTTPSRRQKRPNSDSPPKRKRRAFPTATISPPYIRSLQRNYASSTKCSA